MVGLAPDHVQDACTLFDYGILNGEELLELRVPIAERPADGLILPHAHRAALFLARRGPRVEALAPHVGIHVRHEAFELVGGLSVKPPVQALLGHPFEPVEKAKPAVFGVALLTVDCARMQRSMARTGALESRQRPLSIRVRARVLRACALLSSLPLPAPPPLSLSHSTHVQIGNPLLTHFWKHACCGRAFSSG